MTSKQRAHRVSDVASLLLSFLTKMGGSSDSGDLLRNFCKAHTVDITEAELALSMLMNQRRVEANREMKLQNAQAAA